MPQTIDIHDVTGKRESMILDPDELDQLLTLPRNSSRTSLNHLLFHSESTPLLSSYATSAIVSPTPDASSSSALQPTGSKKFSFRRTFGKHLAGPIAMLIASFLFASMNLGVKVMQNVGSDSEKLHVVQIIFVRSLITYFIASFSMLYLHVKSPFGFPSPVRGLLTLRGLEGFFSLLCSYWAVGILSLGDATVLFFLSPTITGILAAILLREKWEFTDALASASALVGVLFIARPPFLFGDHSEPETPDPSYITVKVPWTDHELHFAGIIVAIFGALFQSLIFITVRKIGRRAHPFHNPLSLAIVCAFSCAIVMLIVGYLTGFENEETKWIWPTARVWVWLFVVSIAGFVGQVCLSKALQLDSAARAATFNYSQVVFAFLLEWALFHNPPNPFSVVGAIIIGGSVVAIAVAKMSRLEKAAASGSVGVQQGHSQGQYGAIDAQRP